MTSITIQDSKVPNTAEALALYASSTPDADKEYDVPTWQNVFKHSKLITAYDGKKLVGITRYLTDGYHDTCVMECIVAKNYQGHGVGRQMMDRLVELYGDTSIYVNALNKSAGFFEKLDLKQRPVANNVGRKAA